MDAGSLSQDVTTTIAEKGKLHGALKGNRDEAIEALSYWLEDQIYDAPASYVCDNKQHGRIEERSCWWITDRAFPACLAQDYGWPDIQVCGRVLRKHCPYMLRTCRA